MAPKKTRPAPVWWQYVVLEVWSEGGFTADFRGDVFYTNCVSILDGIYGGSGKANVSSHDSCATAAKFGRKFIEPMANAKPSTVANKIADWVAKECYPIHLEKQSVRAYMESMQKAKAAAVEVCSLMHA